MILRNGKFSEKNIAENVLQNFPYGKIFHLTSLPVTRLPESSNSHQFCLPVLSAETSLERVGEWAKEVRI
jgi:hypothetical protein